MEHLLSKASSGGRVRVIAGMAFKENLAQNTFRTWKEIDDSLRDSDTSSGIYSFRKPIHSKVYITYDDELIPNKTFVGSSNFNFSTKYMECTVEIEPRDEINNFVNGLFVNEYILDFRDVPTKGSRRDPFSNSRERELQRSNRIVDRNNLTLSETVNLREICLRNPIASLNLYHSAGRKQNGKWTPRPWYEVEITLGRNYPDLPRDFTAITDDGYQIDMQRRSGGRRGEAHLGIKDLTSKGDRTIFGRWIKGKLEESGALCTGDVIDSKTFDSYGEDKLRFYKIGIDY